MKMKFLLTAFLLATAASAFRFPFHFRRCPKYKIRVFIDTAHDAAGLTQVVHDYKAALGGVDNMNRFGPLPDGHRIINWDAPGVPFDMPGDFFNVNVTRGAVFKTKTGEFRVSNPVNEGIKDDRFDSILGKKIARMFVTFSPDRLFTPLNSNKMIMTFRIPAKKGLGARATTIGFGAVFTDVDKKKTTSLTYFDRKGCFIAKVFVPPKSRGLSFAGIIVVGSKHKPIAVIDTVKFKLGNISVAKLAKLLKFFHFFKKTDVVVMDDFIYGEPQEH